MRSSYRFTIALCFVISCKGTQSLKCQQRQKSNFEVSGFIKGSSGKMIILANKPRSGITQPFRIEYYDSVYAKNDSFRFGFYLKEPSLYSIEIKGDMQWCGFVASPGVSIRIEGRSDSLYNAKVEGSTEDSIYTALVDGLLKPMYKKMYQSSPDSFKIYPSIINDLRYRFIKQNPGSFIVAKYLVADDSYNRPKDSAQLAYMQKCYLALSPEAKKFTCSRDAYYNLFVLPERLIPGKKIPGFRISNFTGNKFDLYDYMKSVKEKYYLIDFWASWCVPCVAQFPALKSMYEQYHKRGFQIIGFSLDVERSKLVNFLSSHNPGWINLSDLRADQSELYSLFRLGAIPANFLIDANGVIEAVDITPGDLEEFLQKNLKWDF